MSQSSNNHHPTGLPPSLNMDKLKEAALPEVDVSEHGAPKDGLPQSMDRRLFMQLLVFECESAFARKESSRILCRELEKEKIPSVVYEDLNHPAGLGLLTWSEDPAHFIKEVENVLSNDPFKKLKARPGLTMLGRTYSSGYENDLPFWLIQRPQENVTKPEAQWAIWYPLRRTGAFSKLSKKEQGQILREHAAIGRSYGEAGLANDIRLACHGLDANDNDFVIGLIGKNLHPLSHVVQRMRSTQQTSQYIEKMGPFFVGYSIYQSRSF